MKVQHICQCVTALVASTQVSDLKVVVDKKDKLVAPVQKVEKGDKGDRGEAGQRGPSGLDVSCSSAALRCSVRHLVTWSPRHLVTWSPGHRSPHSATPGLSRNSRRERIQRRPRGARTRRSNRTPWPSSCGARVRGTCGTSRRARKTRNTRRPWESRGTGRGRETRREGKTGGAAETPSVFPTVGLIRSSSSLHVGLYD